MASEIYLIIGAGIYLGIGLLMSSDAKKSGEDSGYSQKYPWTLKDRVVWTILWPLWIIRKV